MVTLQATLVHLLTDWLTLIPRDLRMIPKLLKGFRLLLVKPTRDFDEK